MERDATMDYFVRESAPGASNPELMDTTCAAIQSEWLASLTFPEKQSSLSDEERCARISTVIKKKDIAQNLYDAYAAALIGYSTDDDDFEEIKILHDELTACNEGENTFDFLSDISEPFDFRKNCLKLCEQKQSVSQIDGDPCPRMELKPLSWDREH
ncbi:hypothetical protein CEXT_215041 [Caerostris extrusa]|uniref:Uncharacterized protein n=1 Tax=Caerostris extrusa TaxID=172846 RepID=A0AAV4NHH1_CAEEX|nr:hypothetical protein CEXT_215041 [Caerostris extrusa]